MWTNFMLSARGDDYFYKYRYVAIDSGTTLQVNDYFFPASCTDAELEEAIADIGKSCARTGGCSTAFGRASRRARTLGDGLRRPRPTDTPTSAEASAPGSSRGPHRGRSSPRRRRGRER
jgi:hypothetical protein